MRRGELASLVEQRLGPRHVVICGIGSASYAWKGTGSQIPAFYAADPMGLAPGLALGFALASPEREVVLLEGDGDLIMNLGVLLTMAHTAPANLRTIVFHNGRYETGGNQPLPIADRIQLAGIAETTGFSWTAQYGRDASADEVSGAIDALLRAPTPALLVVGVDAESAPYGGPGDYSGVEEKAEFQRQLRATSTGETPRQVLSPEGTRMRIVGTARADGGVDVADLSADGATLTVIAELREFWARPQAFLSRPPDGKTLPLADLRLVPPVLPEARVLCIGLNYLRHVAEGSYRDDPLPAYPTLFARWTRSLTVNGAAVPVPPDEDGLDWEGEIAAWVGRPLIDADPEDALRAVVGYSAFNDMTARRAQKLTSQWILGKNADNSGPLGPMVPAAEVGDLRAGLRVRTRVNGTTVQDGSTDDMVYHVGETLAHISRTLTLQPGDLLATGTPPGVGYARKPPSLLRPGDVVEVEAERLGVLRNHIVGSEHRQGNGISP